MNRGLKYSRIIMIKEAKWRDENGNWKSAEED